MSTLFYAATCQTAFQAPTSRTQIPERIQSMCNMAEQTMIGYEPFFDVRLLVFPEFAHTVPIHEEASKLHEHLAVCPEEWVQPYEKICKKYGCYIQTGTFLEKDSKYPGHVFNATLLIGPKGILSKYRKVNPWIPWEVHSSPADFEDYEEDPFPVVDTELGKLSVAICYDWLFPETIRQIAFNGAEIINRVSAYMDPWGSTTPMDWWTLINRARAIENTVYVVAANQGAHYHQYPPFSWPGSSMIVDFDGRILAQADPGPGEKVVVAPIDIQGLRHERQRRLGHDTRAHFRSQIHHYSHKEYFQGTPEIPTTTTLKDQIKRAKKNIC